MKIQEISLSDFRILEMALANNATQIIIIAEGSFDRKARRVRPRTKIIIDHWESLIVEVYVSSDPSEKGTTIQLNWQENLEKFELIQEIEITPEGSLVLKGFPEKAYGWLTYTFSPWACLISFEETG